MAEGQHNNPFAFLSLIPKFFANIFGNNNNTNSSDYNEKSVISVDEEEASRTKTKTPAVVRFPKTQPEVPPLKLENEDADNDTNPIILWQIYAFGGFIVLKWAWKSGMKGRQTRKRIHLVQNNIPPQLRSILRTNSNCSRGLVILL